MSTSYPTSIDTFVNPLSTDSMQTVPHNTQHDNINDAVTALETKVGVNGSAVTSTHDYKLSGVGSGDKAVSKTGTEVLTNKTLTSPLINVGSDATGDIYYRNASGILTRLPIGTAGQILDVSAGGIPEWIANPAAANASTAVKGVAQAATSAQVTAGTAIGSTGAVLVVTPDALAASAPTFSAANLTNMPGIIASSVTPVALNNANTTENTLFTIAIAAGLLGTTHAIRASIYGTFTGAAGVLTLTLRAKYGSTNASTIALTTANLNGNFEWQVLLYAVASASVQGARSIYRQFPTIATQVSNGAVQAYVTDSRSLTEASAGALNLVFSSQINSTSQAPSMSFDNYLIEKI